jgi:hypothetical protein
VPARVVANFDVMKVRETSDDLIVERTGFVWGPALM